MTVAYKLHKLFNELPRISFPIDFNEEKMRPGLFYILFENGEKFDTLCRVTLLSSNIYITDFINTLIKPDKYKSRLRRLIGEALLVKAENIYYSYLWSDSALRQGSTILDADFEVMIETEVSKYMRDNMSLAIFYIDEYLPYRNDRNEQEKAASDHQNINRVKWKKKILATLITSEEFQPSQDWLGKKASYIDKMWLEPTDIQNETMTDKEFEEFKYLVKTYI